MPSPDRIGEYADTVCGQIRWKKVHDRVREEMTNHLADGRDGYMARGFDEESATERAIAEAGDAAAIGTQLDRLHRPNPQGSMLAATAVLLVMGLLVRLFIFNDEDRVGLMSVRLLYTAIGLGGMAAAYFADFTLIGKYPKTVYWGLTAISVAVLLLFPSINSPSINGRSFYGQYMILLFPLAFSAILFIARNKGCRGLVICALALVPPGLIALWIGSVPIFLHFTVVGMALFGIAVYKKWFNTKRTCGFLMMLVPAALFAAVFLTQFGWARLAVAFNPSLDPKGAGYMGIMVKELLGGAVFFGTGHVPEEYVLWLTEPHMIFYTDLLLTALISSQGWIVFAVIVSVLFFFMAKGFMLCLGQRSGLGFFVSMSVLLSFCVQALTYIGFNLGFAFAVPVSLPLISYGNTATVVNLAMIGFMLSVFRTGHAVIDKRPRPAQ